MLHDHDDLDIKNPFRPDGTLRREVDDLLKKSTITRNQCIIPSSICNNSTNYKVPLKTCISKCMTSSKERTVRFSPNTEDNFDELHNNSIDLTKLSFSNGNNVSKIIVDDIKEAIVEQPIRIEKLGTEHNHLAVENVNIQVEKCCKIV